VGCNFAYLIAWTALGASPARCLKQPSARPLGNEFHFRFSQARPERARQAAETDSVTTGAGAAAAEDAAGEQAAGAGAAADIHRDLRGRRELLAPRRG
jgi:hypothetical protein